jgi:hypothetical protein
MIRRGGLRRLGEAVQPSTTEWSVDRLSRAWRRLVGSALAAQARPLAIRRGVLVLGCSDPALLSSLRQSATRVWPELRERIERLTRLKLSAIKVEPCDPEPPKPPDPVPGDAFAEVLERYRCLGKEPLDSRRR